VRSDLGAPSAAGSVERFTLSGLAPNTFLFIAVRARDEARNWGAGSNVLAILTPMGPARAPRGAGVAIASVAQPARPPVALAWRGAPETPRAPQYIRLYDLGGRMLRTIAVGADTAGLAQWDGRDQNGRLVPAGLYFARLISGSFHAQARVVLLP